MIILIYVETIWILICILLIVYTYTLTPTTLKIAHHLVTIGEMPIEITDDTKRNEIDDNAIVDLHSSLAYEVLSSVEGKNIIEKIWDTLTKLYKAKSLHNKIFLKRRLCTLWMV